MATAIRYHLERPGGRRSSSSSGSGMALMIETGAAGSDIPGGIDATGDIEPMGDIEPNGAWNELETGGGGVGTADDVMPNGFGAARGDAAGTFGGPGATGAGSDVTDGGTPPDGITETRP